MTADTLHLTYPANGATLCGFGLATRPHGARYLPWSREYDLPAAACPVCAHVAICDDGSCCVSHDATAASS